MHAFIEFSGKQFRVEEGASIKVPRLKEKIGTKISVENILLLEDGKKTTIGKPFIKGKKSFLMVEAVKSSCLSLKGVKVIR